jgi:sulfane dehydrogenase subunit SoxC
MMSSNTIPVLNESGEGLPASQVDSLWTKAVQHGLGRRRFLQLLSLGGPAAVLAACNTSVSTAVAPTAADAATPTAIVEATATAEPAVAATVESTVAPTEVTKAPPWFKDTTALIERGSNLETKLENLHGFLTPNDLFFVRNHSVSVDIDPDEWRLVVEGDGIETPLELTYQDILNLPSRTVFAYLECAGNHRSFFDTVNGTPAEGTQWLTGAISNGEWSGASVRDILTLAGIKDEAVDVLFIGLDVESPEEGFRRVLPVEKALDPDTLLAYTLNGAPLPKDHGYPVRALVPGWVGSSSVKWLGRIEVSTKKIWTRNNTSSYVLIGDDYAAEGEAEGPAVTTQSIKSALALPWPAELAAGTHQLRGFAHSPVGGIEKVEWSADGGETWNEATLIDPQVQYSWVRFEFEWEAEPGEYTILTRAIDVEGNAQRDEVPFNEQGYLFNQPLPHPITVA